MGAMDACNRRFGRGTVAPAGANVERRRNVVNEVSDADAALYDASERAAAGARVKHNPVAPTMPRAASASQCCSRRTT